VNNIRVCSYNIHKGFSASNRRFLLDDMRHAIRLLDSDVVFLQEVVGHDLQYKGAGEVTIGTQFEFLADEIWPHYAYGQNAVVAQGHHGNVVLTKYPISDWRNIDISHWWFSQRGLLSCRLQNGLQLVCVHLGLFASERSRQLEQLAIVLNSELDLNQPLLVAGDFNDWNLSLHARLLSELGLSEVMSKIYGRPAKTFPARLPLLAMDRIYYKNLELVDAGVLNGGPWARLSDHAAVSAIFSW